MLSWAIAEPGFVLQVAKSDLARFAYMLLYGGVYADLDVVCLKPFSALLDYSAQSSGQSPGVVLGMMGDDYRFEVGHRLHPPRTACRCDFPLRPRRS